MQFLIIPHYNNMIEQIESEIKCAICLDDYDSPISLYCGHTFCRECLKKAQNMTCPICRSIIFSSIDNMRQNDTICKLINQIRNRRAKTSDVFLFEPEEQRLQFQQFFDVEKVKLKNLAIFQTCSRKLLLPFMNYNITIKSQLWEPPKQLKNVVIKQNMSYINKSYRPYYIYGHLNNIVRKPNSLLEFDCIFQTISFFEVESQQIIYLGDKQVPSCSGNSMNEKTGLQIQHFQPFFKIYDKISQHYKNSILTVVNPDSFKIRKNSLLVLYSIFSLLNIGDAERYCVLTTFDDQIRLRRLRSFFTNISMDHAIRNPTAVFNIPVPGYSKTRTVFITIAILFILWKFGFIPSLYGGVTV